MSPMPVDSPSDLSAGSQTTPEPKKNKWKTAGKMVKEEGGAVRFMDSYLWASIHDEVSRRPRQSSPAKPPP